VKILEASFGSTMVKMMSKTVHGNVFQINVKPETVGQRGLPKYPTERALVTSSGLDGDFNRWRHEEAHGDLAMAILLMPLETIEELQEEGWPIKPGDIGENFTTEGIPYNSFAPGNHYEIGKAVITITKINN
jgi:MOSC domain-containing protein YiiM